MKWLSIFVLAIGLVSPSLAQGVLTTSTDKDSYAHGETIQVRVRIDNPTNETFELMGNMTCQAEFRVDDVGPFTNMCTADAVVPIQFSPGSWREWIWEFDPTIFGLAAVEGKINVIGYYPGTELIDSIEVAAPAYVGGQVSVQVLNHVTADDLQPVLDALNVTVLDNRQRTDGRSETWHILGTTVSAAVDTYASDSRFGYFEAPFQHISWTKVDTERLPERPNASPSLSVYPNPCRVQCGIDYSGSPDGRYRLDVFDSQGRSVSMPDAPNTFNATDLPAGVYFVRVVTQNASISKPFTVIR